MLQTILQTMLRTMLRTLEQCQGVKLNLKPTFFDISSLGFGFSKKNAFRRSWLIKFSTLPIMLFKYWFLFTGNLNKKPMNLKVNKYVYR